jgi:CRP-like cAMP-binding protein
VITTEALSQIDLFSGLSDEQLATIARSCEEITCPKGKMLFREGQEAKRLFILLGGIISPHNYAASALCQADSHVLTLDGQELIYVLAQNPAASFAFTRRIAEVISGRLRDSRVALLKPL